jgi:copper chaperone
VETYTVTVKNMINQDDAKKVMETIEHVWGLGQVEVNLSKKEAIFTYDERMASPHDFKQAIKDNGFELSF